MNALYHFPSVSRSNKRSCVPDMKYFESPRIHLGYSYLSSFQDGHNGPSVIISSHFMIKNVKNNHMAHMYSILPF